MISDVLQNNGTNTNNTAESFNLPQEEEEEVEESISDIDSILIYSDENKLNKSNSFDESNFYGNQYGFCVEDCSAAYRNYMCVWFCIGKNIQMGVVRYGRYKNESYKNESGSCLVYGKRTA